jgi:Flp pilus assembly protein TadG
MKKLFRLKALLADRSGGSAITLAISLSAMIGVSGLGTEAGGWYVTKRTMQGAADAAAFTAATALSAGATPAQFLTEARSIAGSYRFLNGSSGVTVAVNSPPSAGSYLNNANAVEVVISQPQTPQLSGLFLSTGPTIEARAVALISASGNDCVLALDKGNVVDVTDSGATNLNLTNCSIYINSSDTTALTMSGGAIITASAAYITGGDSLSGGAKLNTTSGVHTGATPISDPYANVPVPSYSGCDKQNFSMSGGASNELAAGASPYVFCNGLSLSGGSSLKLDPGIYVIDRGSLSISGNSTLTATGGVTIVLTSSTGSNYATVSISGGSTVSINAPASGPTAGIAIYQDRNAPANGIDSLSGGSTQNILGAIYFPNQTVTFSGGAGAGSTSCTQLIALKLSFSGNSTFNSTCTGVGVATIGGTAGQLVE